MNMWNTCLKTGFTLVLDNSGNTAIHGDLKYIDDKLWLTGVPRSYDGNPSTFHVAPPYLQDLGTGTIVGEVFIERNSNYCMVEITYLSSVSQDVLDMWSEHYDGLGYQLRCEGLFSGVVYEYSEV